MSFFNLTDDEIANMETPPEFKDTNQEAKEPEEEEIIEDTSDEQEEEETVEDTGSEEADEEEDDSSNEEDSDDPEKESESKEEEDPKKDTKEEENNSEDSSSLGSNEEEPAINYEEEYKKLFSPIKANGKEITLSNMDEAITMIQLGANYTKKMQSIKPNLKLIKMLQNNNLLDENRISHLIDVSKGDKAAISKLIKDSNIDPLDIDSESGVSYKPNNHRVSDAQIEFDQALSDLTNTEHGQKLIVAIERDFDEISKQAIFKEPQIVRVLADQKKSGIFDQIMSEVEKQKTLGNPEIVSMPYLKAYDRIGNEMKEKGLLKFPEANKELPKDEEKTPVIRQPIKRKPAPKTKVSNGDRAKAASPSTGGTKKKKFSMDELLDMDDEAFEKLANTML